MKLGPLIRFEAWVMFSCVVEVWASGDEGEKRGSGMHEQSDDVNFDGAAFAYSIDLFVGLAFDIDV